MKPKTNQFRTAELELVTYLTLRGIRPVRRSEDDGRAALHYERDSDLEDALISYNDKCPVCHVAFSEVPKARGEAKGMLLDGKMPEKKRSETRGGNR